MVPPEALESPWAKFFLTFLKESKKDLRRLPEDFILGLSRPIGRAFMWVAEGDNEILADTELFTLPEEFTSIPDGDSSEESSVDLDIDEFDAELSEDTI